MDYRILGSTGLKVSKLGLGGGPFGSLYGYVDQELVNDTVNAAFDMGVNFFDTAPAYGATLSEQRLGKALKNLPRDKFILSTKTGKFSNTDFDYSYDRIIRAVEESMQRLHVDHIDIYSLHDFEFNNGNLKEQALDQGIRALQDLKEQGKIRFFGPAIYPVDWTIEVLEEYNVDTCICHNHHMLSDNRVNELIPVAQKTNTGIIGASPFGMGLLTEKGPSPWHPADKADLAIFKKAVQLCRDHNTTIEQVAVQYTFSYQNVPVTLVGARNKSEIEQSVEWSNQAPERDLVDSIKDVLKPVYNKDWVVG